MKSRIGLSLCTISLLSGCVQSEILDDIAIEIARSYDQIEENKIKGTMLVYNFQPDKSIKNTTLTTTATTSREIANKLQKQASQPLSEGSLEVILFGKELASQGLFDYLDAPIRNASIGARLFIVTVDGSAHDLITGEYGSRGNAIFISDLLNHNIEQEDLPNTNLQLFFHDYYQLGKTGYLPQIKKIADDKLKLNGISLFQGDKIQVVDTIEAKNMFFFKLLVDSYSEGTQKIKVNDSEAIIRSITSKKKMKITRRNPFEITIQLKIKGIIREYTGPEILSKPLIRKIEKKMEEQVTKECEKLIKRFKEHKVDPIGLGFFIKTRTRGFNLKGWEDGEEYQSLKVKIKTNVEIVESGVIE
ncbi:Ger(x)C family spore germination protein [Bacillus sp. CGMCC 1.16607]|uniref:Ger(x)C family spore germination protein n=1 Tax=Bacillus sp. CGMCC 1.16607 TaxID=3351842 RepID=UPI003637DDE8